MNGYELSRAWFDYSFANPDKVKPIHSAIYFFAIEHCNRLGWKDKFGFPSQMVMEALGIKNWRTYSKALNQIVEFGFINMLEVSKNQYSSNIIAIVKNTKANTKALDKALQKHSTKQGQSTVSINKQLNKETIELINNNASLLNDKLEFWIEQENKTVDTLDYVKLLSFINLKTGRKFKTINDNVKKKLKARLKDGYTKEDIQNAIVNACNASYHVENGKQYLTPEFFSRSDTLDKYSSNTTQNAEQSPNVVKSPKFGKYVR